MNKLWIFGCSHATGDYNLLPDDATWMSIVANNLNLIETNYARSGSSNDSIVNRLIDTIPKFLTGDRIIVMMTYPHRILYNNKELHPSRQTDAWWYRTIMEEDFYSNKFVQQLLSVHHLLAGHNYSITFTDPTLLFKLSACNKNIKQYFSANCFFLPKLLLTKSYQLGEDQKHMSATGHTEIAKFISSKLD